MLALPTLPIRGEPHKPRQGTIFPSLPTKSTQSISVCMVEPGDDKDRGSMGCQYVLNAARDAGFHVEYVTPEEHATGGPWDVEMVSVHHCTEFPLVRDMPRRAKVRILGGHPTANNPRPVIPFADAVCIGEGEEWIAHALHRLNRRCSIDVLADLPGTILRNRWEYGTDLPETNTVEPLPKHPPYLNRSGEGHAQVWYLEMARGCPFQCHYCELGWAWKYRPQDTQFLLDSIRSIDTKRCNRISLFAPDEASHPGYHECLDEIHRRKIVTSFGSMRLDVIVKKNLPFKSNMLIRVGLDGMTESTRKRVHKPIADEHVYEYFRYMTQRGHHNFKVFMVFGYPWETPDDVDEWASLWDRVARIRREKNAHVRVKFTPLIPQPSTPLGRETPRYDPYTVGAIQEWFKRVAKPWQRPGWFVESDGIMSAKSHALQCLLTLGDERTLIEQQDWTGTETLVGYDVFH